MVDELFGLGTPGSIPFFVTAPRISDSQNLERHMLISSIQIVKEVWVVDDILNRVSMVHDKIGIPVINNEVTLLAITLDAATE